MYYNCPMEFFLNDPQLPRVPPEATRILNLHAEPYPDGKRLRVALDLMPFQQKPNIELTLTDSTGEEAASASVVEPMTWKLELTLHIRNVNPSRGKYTLTACLSYPDLGEVDRREVTFEIPDAEEK
jgi:hypothetical protein